MHSLVSLIEQKYPNGGTIRIYNLFNLAEPKSSKALEVFPNVSESEWTMTPMESLDFHNVPVIVATGGSAHAHPKLEEQLRRYIAKAPADKLYAIVRSGNKTFSVEKAIPNEKGLIESYHLSYTCKYGNTTKWR